MYLKKLELKNFRNYSNLEFGFKSRVTILIGNNAQGKTNFLDAIFFLATAKSQRAQKDEELIKAGEDFLYVGGQLEDETSLEIALQNQQGVLAKRVKVNGIPRRVMDYSGNLAVVLFSPEDINLVSGSPSLRRNFIDNALSQTDRDYKKAISAYEDVITKKNRLLKRIREGFSKLDELYFWQQQQLSLGRTIFEKRKQFFLFLNSVEKKFGQFNYQYLSNTLNESRLKEYQTREIEAASSLIGPQRDDFIFELSGSDLGKFGSRGEQRTAVLDLKFSEVAFIEQVRQNRPLLLLDDIFSELDDSHRQHVVEIARLQQTIISTVEWDKYLEQEFKDQANLFLVQNGKISSKGYKLLKQSAG